MKPKISIITLGVADLERSVAFYRDGLSLPLREDYNGNIAFFTLEGVMLALYPREALAEDAQLPPLTELPAFPGITLAHNVPSKEDVAVVLNQAKDAGGTVVKEAQDVFWGGHSGYFKDPDGFLWEVAYNPFTDLS